MAEQEPPLITIVKKLEATATEVTAKCNSDVADEHIRAKVATARAKHNFDDLLVVAEEVLVRYEGKERMRYDATRLEELTAVDRDARAALAHCEASIAADKILSSEYEDSLTAEDPVAMKMMARVCDTMSEHDARLQFARCERTTQILALYQRSPDRTQRAIVRLIEASHEPLPYTGTDAEALALAELYLTHIPARRTARVPKWKVEAEKRLKAILTHVGGHRQHLQSGRGIAHRPQTARLGVES